MSDEDELQLPGSESADVSGGATRSCLVCFDELTIVRFPKVPCCAKQDTCDRCFREALRLDILQHEGKIPQPKCPSCSEALSEADVRRLCSAKDLLRYDGILIRHAVEGQPGWHACPKQNCMGMGWLPSGEYGKVACPTCGHGWLVQSPSSGLLGFGSLSSISSHLRSEWWKSRNTRPCPSCGARISKNQGCPHVTCRVAGCRHEFCWFCLLPWGVHNPLFCFFWMVRFVLFWLFALLITADLPAEYAALPTLGLCFAVVRRVSNVMRTLALDQAQPERELRRVHVVQAVMWSLFPLLAWWVVSAPHFWRGFLYVLFGWLVPLAIAGFATFLMMSWPLGVVALAVDVAALFFHRWLRAVFTAVVHYTAAFFVQALAVVLLPLGAAVYVLSGLFARHRHVYTFNMFSNGLTVLRFWLIMALLQTDVSRSYWSTLLLAAVEWAADLLADVFAAVAAALPAPNPLHAVAALALLVLPVLFLVHSLDTSLHGRARVLLRVALAVAVAAVVAYSPLPLAQPTPLGAFYREKLKSVWFAVTSHALFRVH